MVSIEEKILTGSECGVLSTIEVEELTFVFG